MYSTPCGTPISWVKKVRQCIADPYSDKMHARRTCSFSERESDLVMILVIINESIFESNEVL